MSSPVRTLVPASTANATVNTRKRVLTDSEDTEERDSKRARPHEGPVELDKQKDAKGKDKEKKKKRKKRRKVPVVQAPDSSDAEIPALVHNAKVSRVRSRSVNSSGPSTMSTAISMKMEEPEARLPSAGPSRVTVACTSPAPQSKNGSSHSNTTTHATLEDKGRTNSNNAAAAAREPSSPLVKEEALTPIIASSADKGKARAISHVSETQAQVTELRGQITTMNKLVTDHDSLLSTLQQSLSCQICLDLMHRPFALSPCGHSACHQCLVNWFKAPPADVPANQVPPTWLRRKTCPHCRAVVKDRPLEIWAIKEMVANLVKSGLAQGFFSPEAANGPANADPWAGIFRPERGNQLVFPDGAIPPPVGHLMGQRDDEDDVYRCIDCFHEIMDGECSNCGRVYPGHNPDFGSDDYDDDDDDDDSIQELWRDQVEHLFGGQQALNLDDRYAFFDVMPHPFAVPPPPPHDEHDSIGWDAGGDTEIESDSNSIDWDAGGDTEIESDGDVAQGNWQRRLPLPRVTHIEELDDEEGEEEDGYESSFIDDDDAPVPFHECDSSSPSHIEAHVETHVEREATIELSDGDEEDEVQFIGLRRGSARGRGPIVIESDEEDGDIVVDGDGHGLGYGHGDIGSDEERNHRSIGGGHEEGEYLSDEDRDLAGEVAAREYAMYGDDGSVPRRNFTPRPYGGHYISDEESYHSYSDEEDDGYGYF